MTVIPDISVILTAGREGRLVHRTLNSLTRARQFAAEAGLDVEVVPVLDRADEPTRQRIGERFDRDDLHGVDFGDVARARNYGVHVARGQLIAFLAAGDLYDCGWIVQAARAAQAEPGDSVCHPRWSVRFGGQVEVTLHPDASERNPHFLDLLQSDLWTYCVAGRRDFFLGHPFSAALTGYGHSVRHWFCELQADGVSVRTLDDTCVFLREPRLDDRQREAIMRPSRLFEEEYIESHLPATYRSPLRPRHKPGRGLRFALLRWGAGRVARSETAQVVVAAGTELLGVLRRWLPALRPRRRMPLPAWLIEEWKTIHAIEPGLFPAPAVVRSLRVSCRARAPIAEAYLDLSRRLGSSATHVFLVPWLVKAGADLEVLNYAHALAETGHAQGVVVITLLDVDSPWADRLPAGARLVEFGKLYGHLSEQNQTELLARVLLQKAPRVVQNVNSWHGYQLFLRHGRALGHASRLFCLVFCPKISPLGQIAGGFVFDELPECIDDLTAVFSDNRAILEQLEEKFGVARGKLLVHYQPVAVSAAPASKLPPGPRKSLNVLWAGRLDRQKRPDLLVKTAQICREDPIHFHMYGYGFLEADIPKWRALKNVTYHGAYDGFATLPLERFDAFLYTSQWDGIPNVLLEAMAAGLPVIASDVGGIRELVIEGETGFLVSPFDDVSRYAEALLTILRRAADVGRLVSNALRLVQARHSRQAFLARLRAVPGYLDVDQASFGGTVEDAIGDRFLPLGEHK